MENRIIKWGIIGCGDVCEVKSGPAFYKSQNSALHAVMRRDAEKAKDFANRHNVPKFYSSAEELINDPEIDVVYIATPPGSHAELAIKVLQAGKPVYVEKPMATSYKECLQMTAVAKEQQQSLWVAYYRRSLPYFLKIKKLLEQDAIGELLWVKGEFYRPPLASDLNPITHTWRLNKNTAGGGYFYDMGSHTIDILLFLLGEIKTIQGFKTNQAKLYTVEDTVSASFLFESGVIGHFFWNYASFGNKEKDTIEIVGKNGSIRFSTFSFDPIILEVNGTIKDFAFNRPEHIQQNMIQSIVDEINGIGKCPSTGESAAITNRIMEELTNGK